MYKKLKIVRVDSKYCNYLRTFDNKVMYNAGTKKLRPFIGILFKVEGCEYFAPLSSPKPKHMLLKNTLDLIKINSGKYGVVNLNNMIPVESCNYVEFDLNKTPKNKTERARIEILKNQLRWLTMNKKQLNHKSKLLYDLYKNRKLPINVVDRCCNFLLLEEKCKTYNNKKKKQNLEI